MNIKGEITVESDNVRRVMEYGQKLVKSFPADTVGYDNTSNNRALISGKSALIYNPQSAWAAAKRDAPEDREGLLDLPLPGRYIPFVYVFYGIWGFAKTKSAAKELVQHLLERDQLEERAVASEELNLPTQVSMSDFKIWAEVEPPKAQCATTLSVHSIIQRRALPPTPHLRRLRFRTSLARSPRQCGRGSTADSRSTRRSPGRRTSCKGSFAKLAPDTRPGPCPGRRSAFQ